MPKSEENPRRKNIAFESVNSKDPLIKKRDSKISFYPVYWNYYFISTFLIILAVGYLFTLHYNDFADVCIILGIGILVIISIKELTYCNRVVIDLNQKKISIRPNPILGFILKKKSVLFYDVKKIDFKPTISSPEFRRYLIKLTLKDSGELNLISSSRADIAQKICDGLSLILASKSIS